MKYYMILKPLYNERAKRILPIGKIWTFEEADGQILAGLGIVMEVEPQEIEKRKRQYRRKRDPELDKLDNMEV